MHRDADYGDNSRSSNHNFDMVGGVAGSWMQTVLNDIWTDPCNGQLRIGHNNDSQRGGGQRHLDFGNGSNLYGDHGHGHGHGDHGPRRHGRHQDHGSHSFTLNDEGSGDSEPVARVADTSTSSATDQQPTQTGDQTTAQTTDQTAQTTDHTTDQTSTSDATESHEQLQQREIAELLNRVLELEQQVMRFLQQQMGGSPESGECGQSSAPECTPVVSEGHGSTEPSTGSDHSGDNSGEHGTSEGSDHVDETPTTSAEPGQYRLQDALDQNDMNKRGQIVANLPFHGPNSWADGKAIVDNNVIPPGVTNYAPWGVLADEQGKTVDRNTVVDMKDQHVYFHKKDGSGWVDAANPSNTGFWDANYYNDLHGNLSQDSNPQTLADGTFRIHAAPEGMMSHFGSGNTPVPFDPNLYDGVFSRIDVKADRNNSGLVMDAAGDYYRDQGKIWGEEGQNDSNLRNPGAGTSNWSRLTTDWQTLYYTTMDADVLRNSPPPGMS